MTWDRGGRNFGARPGGADVREDLTLIARRPLGRSRASWGDQGKVHFRLVWQLVGCQEGQ